MKGLNFKLEHISNKSIKRIIFFQVTPVIVWEKSAIQSSIVMPKGSTYSIFLKDVVQKLRENGQVGTLLQKYEAKQPSCEELFKTGKALSIQKLASAFMIVVIGVCTAIIIGTIEKLLKPPKQKIDANYQAALIRQFFRDAKEDVCYIASRETLDQYIDKVCTFRNSL